MIATSQSDRATILNVDDDNTGRLLISELLRRAGFEVVEAASGKEALHQAAEQPDLVLLDVHLGDMTGYEVCQRLKSHPATRSIPVVEISGVHVDGAQRTRGLDFGADAYLIKPVEPAFLVAQLKALVRLRQAEKEAKAAQAKLAAIIGSSTDAIIAETADRIITNWNTGAERLYGYTAAEAIGKSMSMLYPPERAAEFPQLLARLRRGEDIPAFETVRARKNGERVDVSISISRMTNQDGQLTGFVVIARDITEHKRVQERLARDALLLANVRDAVIVTNLKGTITYWNEGASRLFGWQAEQVLGQNYIDRLPETNRPMMAAHLQAVAEGEEWSGQWEDSRKDGSKVWIDARLSRLDNTDGKPLGILVLGHDVTERKRLEDQYRQTQKMEAIGRLAGGVAHDFNNLLTIINGYTDLVLDKLPSADMSRELLGDVKKAGTRASSLTRQLLAFSRQQILAPQVLDLNDVIVETDKMLRRLIGEDIDLETKLDRDLRRVKADPGQIEQVLLNLAVNARDAMPQGGMLTIETRNVDLRDEYPELAPGPYVMLAVSDTGHGMTREVKERIFEPFFTTKPAGHGTGLGLATVFGIVKQSEGYITVYSEPQLGTTFRIYLPETDKPLTMGRTYRSLHERPKGNETILLAEDDEALRTLAKSALERQGYEVLQAANGADAIQLCERERGRIDLVITDVIMPEMGGRKLAEWLAGHRPEAKVLFVSGYTDDAIVRHGVLKAEVEFLQKPFSIGALTRKVRSVLDAAS